MSGTHRSFFSLNLRFQEGRMLVEVFFVVRLTNYYYSYFGSLSTVVGR